MSEEECGGTLNDLTRKILNDGEISATRYLKHYCVGQTMVSLRDARRRSGLTTKQVAERLKTTPAVVTHLENDHDGNVSLRRITDYAAACGYIPVTIAFSPIEDVRQAVLAALDAQDAALGKEET